MKNSFILIIIIALISCKKEVKTTIDKPQINFDFLLGDWIRTNDKQGSKTYEYWIKVNANLYQGLGCTLKGKDTVFKEKMELTKENLTVSGVNEKPTVFKITSFTNTNFTAENPENEFPKVIKYQFKDDFLLAEISADSMKVAFKFNKYKNNKYFLNFFDKFSKDSIFQYQNIKFPLENEFYVYENNMDMKVLELIKAKSWKFIDFSKDKNAINKEYDKFTQEFKYIDNKHVVYTRTGHDNGIMINYYFEKIKNHWILTKIIDQSN